LDKDGLEDGAPLARAGVAHTPIGQQLRRARLAAGISLREMARRVDVSASFISQVELGRTMPSVGTLYSIASELGVSLDGLMPTAQPPGAAPATPPGDPAGARAPGDPAGPSGPAEPGPPNKPGMPPETEAALRELREARTPARPFIAAEDADAPVQRAVRRHELKIGGAIWGRLTAGHDRANDFLHVVYKPGGESCPEDQMIHHRGFEYGYVISGRLRVQVGFDDYELGEGDSISFESMTPHRLSNPYTQQSESIWMVVGRGGTPVL
jgi:mannose-6-phosphate isomerase-like protein (cupin superfamily)/DNA-binding XRE family transcriptional regulator